MNIPNSNQKSKFFIPVLLVVVALGAFGLGKLYTIEHTRIPISIEYPATSTVASVVEAAPQIPEKKVESGMYVGSRGGTSYYLPSCSGAKRISEKNKIWFVSKGEAERLGYKPAKTCKGI